MTSTIEGIKKNDINWRNVTLGQQFLCSSGALTCNLWLSSVVWSLFVLCPIFPVLFGQKTWAGLELELSFCLGYWLSFFFFLCLVNIHITWFLFPRVRIDWILFHSVLVPIQAGWVLLSSWWLFSIDHMYHSTSIKSHSIALLPSPVS